jgi:alpha-glucuronidase
MKKMIWTGILLLLACHTWAEDGYELWLRYKPVENKQLLATYRSSITSIQLNGNSATTNAIREELANGLQGLLQVKIPFANTVAENGTLIIGTAAASKTIADAASQKEWQSLGEEGYFLFSKNILGKSCLLIGANTDIGLLYGSFELLRLLQTNSPVKSLHLISAPRIKLRMLNHWDNLNRSVERGYAGTSIWRWQSLPLYLDKRYKDYARANASIGINGSVLTNVNANTITLTKEYLEKAAALANVFRPYGIKVYLTARFSAPIEMGSLKTADPLDTAVRRWWKEKINEIYSIIPDFGGLLIKANSEGQPGPQNYGRNHADGADMLADALAPHKGILMWRAFVYSETDPDDRHKQAYSEFVPLDGKFKPNALVQVKNGAIDFQPREPFHPLFGAMPKTPLMMEFQLTQEYLGFATHLVYEAPLFKECLDSDTYAKGKGSTVAKVVDGSLDHHTLSGMAGVANIGSDINWSGHPFAQANWYALGRMAWDHELSSAAVADEWLRMTFSNDPSFIEPIKKMMLNSREITVKYMTPLGLHHIMGSNHHYGPAPWVKELNRPEWNPVYYHKADSAGIGFNRTASGSNALGQYFPEVRKQFENAATCPDEYLLWFHHLPWTFKMKNGQTLWKEICFQYYAGVDSVRAMQKTWKALENKIDPERFAQVNMLLQIQEEEAVWWRNACILYFQTFSKMPIPEGLEKPDKTLEYYKGLRFPYAGS